MESMIELHAMLEKIIRRRFQLSIELISLILDNKGYWLVFSPTPLEDQALGWGW